METKLIFSVVILMSILAIGYPHPTKDLSRVGSDHKVGAAGSMILLKKTTRLQPGKENLHKLHSKAKVRTKKQLNFGDEEDEDLDNNDETTFDHEDEDRYEVVMEHGDYAGDDYEHGDQEQQIIQPNEKKEVVNIKSEKRSKRGLLGDLFGYYPSSGYYHRRWYPSSGYRHNHHHHHHHRHGW